MSGDPGGEIGTAWSVPPGGPRGARTAGGVAFAGVLMLCGGVLAALQGIAALAGDDVVYADVGGYTYAFGLTGWGWIHLVLGTLAALTGAALLGNMPRARPAGVLLAALGLVAQFLFLPYQPLWSVTVMAIDVFVIRALTARPG